jgi:hypothetical protein
MFPFSGVQTSFSILFHSTYLEDESHAQKVSAHPHRTFVWIAELSPGLDSNQRVQLLEELSAKRPTNGEAKLCMKILQK